MKEFTSQQIEQTRRVFGKEGFPVEKAMVGDLEVSYYVIPQGKNPNLPDFAFRMTTTDLATREVSGIFGVSDSIPAELRPYWAAHEIIEFTQIGINQPGRCTTAEEKVVGLMPDKLRGAYVDRRRTFFSNLLVYFRQDAANYTQDDIEEAETVLSYLQELQPQIPVDTTEHVIGVENDQYGHVNYKAYPGLFEPAQDAYMLARGITFDGIEQDYGLKSVVPTYTPIIHAESFSGDGVRVETRIERVGNSSFTFAQSMKRGETAIADFSMVVVLVDQEGKPVSIPQPIREKLQAPIDKQAS